MRTHTRTRTRDARNNRYWFSHVKHALKQFACFLDIPIRLLGRMWDHCGWARVAVFGVHHSHSAFSIFTIYYIMRTWFLGENASAGEIVQTVQWDTSDVVLHTSLSLLTWKLTNNTLSAKLVQYVAQRLVHRYWAFSKNIRTTYMGVHNWPLSTSECLIGWYEYTVCMRVHIWPLPSA